MIYTVTFNPSLDYIVSVENFKTGTVNRTTSEKIYPGGKGINVSMVLGNLGIESRALGFSAGFTGDELERLLDERKVKLDFIRVKQGMTRINVKLYSNEKISNNEISNIETEINGQGPAISDGDIDKLYEKLDRLKDGDILVLAGSIPSVMPSSIYMDIMKHLQNKNLKIVVDATKDLLVNVLKYHPFLIKPNNYELGEIFEVKLDSKDKVVTYAKKLQELGALNVLVSMAGEGAVLVTENADVYKMDAPKGKVINSVGAGDSMVAGFLAGYLEKNDYFQALKMGVCTGSASAFSNGLATKDEVMKLLKK
jgi:1-phosphofructokinase